MTSMPQTSNPPFTSAAHKWLVEYETRSDTPNLKEGLLAVQARRAALIVGRLSAGTALVLPDPVGTGKTAVALVAAGILLEKGSVRRLVVVAPNDNVRRLWKKRIGWLVSPSTGRTLPTKSFEVMTRKQLVRKRKPVKAYDVLVVIDEAHRGLQAEGDFHEQLERWTQGCQVLLVTATPFLLSSQGLTTMLKIGQGTSDNGKAPIEAYGAAVTSLASEYRAAVHRASVAPASEPTVVAALEEAVARKPAAAKVLARRILPHDPELESLRGKPPTLKKDPVKVSASWKEAYHVARVVPELVETGKGDMFNRRLLSSSEAFQCGTAGKALAQRSSESTAVQKFAAELARALGETAGHPKVAATADWVATRVADGRHVLVFCVFRETQQALKNAIRQRVRRDGSAEGPTGATIDPALVSRFRNPDEDPLVLVLQDRFSESIDLDGGQPCIVHHDLPWTPARVTQRWGRIVRAGSGFRGVVQADIYVPVLDLDADLRLFHTVKARAGIGEVLLPRAVLLDIQDPDADALPDFLLDRLRDGATAVGGPP
jgi:hypothetical protein